MGSVFSACVASLLVAIVGAGTSIYFKAISCVYHSSSQKVYLNSFLWNDYSNRPGRDLIPNCGPSYVEIPASNGGSEPGFSGLWSFVPLGVLVASMLIRLVGDVRGSRSFVWEMISNRFCQFLFLFGRFLGSLFQTEKPKKTTISTKKTTLPHTIIF